MVWIRLGLWDLAQNAHIHTRLVNQFPIFIQFDKPTVSVTTVFTFNIKASIIVDVATNKVPFVGFEDEVGIVITHAAIAPLPVETDLALHHPSHYHHNRKQGVNS